MTVLEVYDQAVELGLRLERSGDRLQVYGEQCPSEFVDILRRHKEALLDWLKLLRSANLTPDCIPWLHVARQVLAGEFDDADKSTRESVRIGLHRIDHPICRRALERLSH